MKYFFIIVLNFFLMSDSIIDPAVVASSAQMLDSALNYMAQTNLNKGMQEWNEKMYARQREDALMDWFRTNEYNHPVQQMARLQQAGLNPNLVYGKGADATASPVRATQSHSWQPKAPTLNIGQGLMSFVDTSMKTAQIDNLRAQNTAIINEGILKAVQASKIGVDTARSQFELDFAKDTRDISLQALQENVRKMATGTDISLQKNERDAAMTASNLQEASARIIKLRADTANSEAERTNILRRGDILLKDARIKELDATLADAGIQPGKSVYESIVKAVVDAITDGDLSGTLKRIIDAVKGRRSGGPGYLDRVFDPERPVIFGRP